MLHLESQENFKNAYNYVIKLLSKQDYSSFKLKKKLLSKGFSEVIIETTLDKIKTSGFFKEENYIESQIRKLMFKGYSPDYISLKLEQEDKVQVDIRFINNIFEENHISKEDQKQIHIKKKMPSNFENLNDQEKQKILSKINFYLKSKGHFEDYF